MHADKGKKILDVSISLIEDTLKQFYVAASSGNVTNKMQCIDFSVRMLNKLFSTYNFVDNEVQRKKWLKNLNDTILKTQPNVADVNRFFMFMQHKLQESKVILNNVLSNF